MNDDSFLKFIARIKHAYVSGGYERKKVENIVYHTIYFFIYIWVIPLRSLAQKCKSTICVRKTLADKHIIIARVTDKGCSKSTRTQMLFVVRWWGKLSREQGGWLSGTAVNAWCMWGGAVVKSTGGGGNVQIPTVGIGSIILYHIGISGFPVNIIIYYIIHKLEHTVKYIEYGCCIHLYNFKVTSLRLIT